ncbi:unnamed protein product [Rodentolepis nana]|uniref:Mediator complex subunit 10 n=1 Tax=Rodentolepis nana TaxID=102285 RepID=A0A0R3T644_RODNA|nr:unnamed protein product [Rodentolepis nana]
MSHPVDLQTVHLEYSSLAAVVKKKVRTFEAVLAAAGEDENAISDTQYNAMLSDVFELLDRGQILRYQLVNLYTTSKDPAFLNNYGKTVDGLNMMTERLMHFLDDLNARCPSKINIS